MYQTEKLKKLPSLLTKTENQRQDWRTSSKLRRHQNRKTALCKCEIKKLNQKLAKSANPKLPTPGPSMKETTVCYCSEHCLDHCVVDTLYRYSGNSDWPKQRGLFKNDQHRPRRPRKTLSLDCLRNRSFRVFKAIADCSVPYFRMRSQILIIEFDGQPSWYLDASKMIDINEKQGTVNSLRLFKGKSS